MRVNPQCSLPSSEVTRKSWTATTSIALAMDKQSDRFGKTIAKIADLVGQDYKSGGITRTEVMTQEAVVISLWTRPQATTIYTEGKETGRTQPDTLDISDYYQSAKKIVDYQLLNQKENRGNKVLDVE
jgi:hypothetical protein